MPGKFAVKKLSRSDLTFFEWHSKKYPDVRQKSINLNADVFIDELYPDLPKTVGLDRKVRIDLFIYGPQNAPELNLQRKIVRSEGSKNWRLNGEFVLNPEDSPARFNILEPDDIGIFDFTGVPLPSTIRMILLARQDPTDVALYQELSNLFQGHDSRKTFLVLTETELETVIQAAQLTAPHVIEVLRIQQDLEEAAIGIQESITKLRIAPSQRTISHEDLENARENASRNGRSGEEIVNYYLQQLKNLGEILDFDWVSSRNAISPYDFKVVEVENRVVYIDAKSTTGIFDRPIHISWNELRQMNSDEGRYDIYRVYDVEEDTPRIAITRDLRDFAHRVLIVLAELPDGVSVDGISVHPLKMSHDWIHRDVPLSDLDADEVEHGA